MKTYLKQIVAVCFAIAIVSTAFAADNSSNYTSKAYKSAMNFHKIEVSNFVSVVVENRTEGNIVAKIHNDFLPYFKIEVKDGTLSAKIDSKSLRSKRYDSTNTFATIYVPNSGKLDDIEAESLSKVTVQCDIKAKEFEIEASGVSQISLQNITAESINIDISGASQFKAAHIVCKEFDCETSGASKLTICGILKLLKLDCSGASDIKFDNAMIKSGNAHITGASNIDCDDSAFEEIVANISGASNVDLVAKRCRAIVSGASKADIECSEQLTLDVSGVSHVKYSGDCKLDVISNSGMSTIKKR